MTTNQTIDGVPRNVVAELGPLIETFRDSLHRGKQPTFSAGDLKHFINVMGELRALLVAPECHVCGDTGSVKLSCAPWSQECIDCKPTALPQGEPMAWYTDDYLTDKSATTYDLATMERWKAKGWPVKSLYAEQPAPVADPLANGFTTLESDCGKYKIVTSFATRDDAWSAYRVLVGAGPKPVAVAPTAYDGFDNGVD